MKKIEQLIVIVIFFVILITSCGKDSPLESGDLAEANFLLSIELPKTRTGIPVSDIEQDKVIIYYGDIHQTSFQQGSIVGDSLIFNYPILLKVGNPGRLRATYVHESYPTVIPGAETLSDSLFVDSEDPSTIQISYSEDEYTITLNFKHCHALADFILPEGETKEVTSLIDKIFVLVCENNGTEKMYVETSSKVIVPAGCLLKYVTLFLTDGKEFQIKNDTPILFERNRRYSIRLSPDLKRMTIEPEEGSENWE
ncbi:MAG: hypothetical protein LBL58_00195 [Tannerellaceae bacterium]|jgi:hypothetical protein|nr:hypothetical protein [Tannerellaceae bacterium]